MTTRTKTLFGLAFSLILTGLVIHQTAVQPNLTKVRNQTRARNNLITAKAETKRQTVEVHSLAKGLGVTDLRDLQTIGQSKKPVVFLGTMLDHAGLKRLELSVAESSASEHLINTKFFLKARGEYRKIVAFLQALEQSTRLVVVELIRINNPNGGGPLECHLNVSIIDPLETEDS